MYPVSVVSQRREGIGLAAIVVVAVAAAAGGGAPGCGGPLDTAPPRPRDAGTNTGAGGKRVVDAAPPSVRDAGFDTGVDVSWPIVPGCISGLPPSPQFSPDVIPTVAVSCSSSTSVILRVSDAAGQGMYYVPRLEPPIDGLSLQYTGEICNWSGDSPIELVVRQAAVRPGAAYRTTLSITPTGPPQPRSVFALNVNAVAIDFSVDPAVVDFGTVTPGQFMRMALTITNATASAPFDTVFSSQQQQGPFLLYPIPSGGALSVQPGESRQMLEAVLNTQAPGTFEATFLVSPFQPGIAIDPACGVIRTVTMRALVIPPGPPPLP